MQKGTKKDLGAFFSVYLETFNVFTNCRAFCYAYFAHVIFSVPGIVGEIGESKDENYIWTHKKFDISYNGDQIVDVSLTSESKTKLSPNTKISFTYEV